MSEGLFVRYCAVGTVGAGFLERFSIIQFQMRAVSFCGQSSVEQLFCVAFRPNEVCDNLGHPLSSPL